MQRVGEAKPGDLAQASDDLYGWLVANALDVPKLLMTLLLQKGQTDALTKQYDEKYHRSLIGDIDSKLRWDDAVRAKCYLKYGELRPADKLYLAIKGQLKDVATVKRLAPEIYKQRAVAEEQFDSSYGSEWPVVHRLPDGRSSKLAGAVVSATVLSQPETNWVVAVLAFGKTRAADDVMIATSMRMSNDDALLFDALQREDPATLAKDFQTSYLTSIQEHIKSTTSFHTEQRALMLLDPSVKPEDRLIRTVEIATSGYTNADSDFIFDALAHATDVQVEKLKAAIATVDPRVKNLDATFGGMKKEDRERLNALIGIGDDGGLLADPTVKQLRKAGGTGPNSVFMTLKHADPAMHKIFRTAYTAGKEFTRFVDQNVDNNQKGWLLSDVFADFPARLHYAMDQPGNDEYVLFLISIFASAAERRAMATDAGFGGRFDAMSTGTQNKILLALQPDSMTPQERGVWLDKAVKRETASGLGALTGDAVTDENRELQAAITRAGKDPTPEQKAEIDRLANRTEDALKVFVKYRDELEAAIAGAVEMAAGMVATIMTGGIASVELALAAVARAALASAMAKVVANKIVRGDRFDVLGAEGAQAFVSGAVEGMLNAVAPAAAKGVESTAMAALEQAAPAAARASAPSAFAQFAGATGKKMVEGAAVGGLTAAADTATRDATWINGFDTGMRTVLTSSLHSAVLGGATAPLPAFFQAALAAAGSLEQLAANVSSLPDPEALSTEAELDLDWVTPEPAVQKLPVQRAFNWGDDFEPYAHQEIQAGRVQGVAPMDLLVEPVHGRQGIDRLGFTWDGKRFRIIQFEMKWRDPAKRGQLPPEAELATPETMGTQTSIEWTKKSIEKFITSNSEKAIAAREKLCVEIPKRLGMRKGTVWTAAELRTFLMRRVRYTKVVVVVPAHVSIKFLWQQLIDIARNDKRPFEVAKVALPPKRGRVP